MWIYSYSHCGPRMSSSSKMRMSMEQVLYNYISIILPFNFKTIVLFIYFCIGIWLDMMEVFKTVWCVQYHTSYARLERDRQTNLFIFVLPCHHPWLSCTSVFFSPVTSHKPTFLHKHNTCTLHSGQDLHTATHTMYMGVLDPPSCLACSLAPCHNTTQARPQRRSSSV